MKDKKLSPLDFKSVSKVQKEELVQWIIQYGDFLDKSPLFLRKIKMKSSVEIKERKILLCEDKPEMWKYLYIIKSGNAFSWFGPPSSDNLIEKSAKEIRKRGMIGEIFCEGDILCAGMDLFTNPLIVITKTTDYPKYFPELKGSILSGIPFDKCRIVPLVLIRISFEEFHKSAAGEKFVYNIAGRYCRHLQYKLIINKWKLWGQWCNKIELKILSVLYLYFGGELPLQLWTRADNGEEVDNKTVSFKKPRCIIKEFEIGTLNLSLFVGMSRISIYNYLLDPRNTLLRKDKKLANLLNCRSIPGENFKFSSPSPLKLLSYIQSKILSSIVKKS